jgi:hypothetical protein
VSLGDLPGVGSGIRELGLRFNLVSLLPTTALALFILALFNSGVPELAPSVDRLLTNIEELSAKQIAAVGVMVLLIALILHPLQLSLVRLLEGYWGASTLGSSLSAIGVELHRRRRERLAELAEQEISGGTTGRLKVWAASEYEAYPAEDRLLPTSLGNALRAAEDRVRATYGLPAVAMMPRLYPYISERFASMFADLRNQLDMSTRFCVTLLIATLISVPVLLPYPRWLAVPAVTAGLSWVSYQAAIRAAMRYGEALHAAFDLHRFDLLKALHLKLPRDAAQERRINQMLENLFVGKVPPSALSVTYQHPESGDSGGRTP